MDNAPAITFSTGAAAGTVAVINEEPVTVTSDLKYAANLNNTEKPMTEAQFRQLRGKYFTVRHIPLEECGHKMDTMNEPRHRNCENCWFQWLNCHPSLIEAVDGAWKSEGKEFVISMRGSHFAKMFARYMATVAHLKEQEKNGQGREAGAESTSHEGREVQGNQGAGQAVGQDDRRDDVSDAGEQGQSTDSASAN